MPTHDTTHIPEWWREMTLGELLKPKGYIRWPFWSALLRSELLESWIPVYEQQNAIYNHRNFRFYINEEKYESLKRFTVAENDLIISCSGTLWKVSLIKKEDAKWIISQALLLIRPNPDKINPLYIYNFFNSKEGFNALVSRSTWSVQVNLAKREIIENVPFLLPPLPEQRAIADMLSSLDAKIELLREQNETLEKAAQTIFHEWFGRYSVESPEELPEGWRVGKLGEEFDITIGRTPPRAESEWFSDIPTWIKWISIRDIWNSGTFIFNTSEYLTNEAVTKFNIPVIPKNTTILSFKMTVGKLTITTEEMVSNEAIAHMKIKKSSYLTSEYIYLWLQSLDFNSLWSTSSIVTAINSTMIKNIDFILPSEEVLRKFMEHVLPIFHKTYNNSVQIQSLSKTRDTLLPKLMSGEMRI